MNNIIYEDLKEKKDLNKSNKQENLNKNIDNNINDVTSLNIYMKIKII